MSLHVQFQTMGMMLCGGLALGAWFDVIRVTGAQWKFPKWLVAVCDLVYWLSSTVLIFYMLYVSNSGDMRFFVLIGLFLGVWIYYLCLSPLTVRAVLAGHRFLKRVAEGFRRLFQWLVLRPLGVLYKGFILFFGFLAGITIFLLKIMLQLTYPIQKLFLWLMKVTGMAALWNRLKAWFSKR